MMRYSCFFLEISSTLFFLLEALDDVENSRFINKHIIFIHRLMGEIYRIKEQSREVEHNFIPSILSQLPNRLRVVMDLSTNRATAFVT